MKDIIIAEVLHLSLSAFRVGGNQDSYPSFSEISEENKNLYLGAIAKIRSGEIKTPKQVHDFWIEYAKKHNPNHPSIVPFKKLSAHEKAKDAIVISVVKPLIKH